MVLAAAEVDVVSAAAVHRMRQLTGLHYTCLRTGSVGWRSVLRHRSRPLQLHAGQCQHGHLPEAESSLCALSPPAQLELQGCRLLAQRRPWHLRKLEHLVLELAS